MNDTEGSIKLEPTPVKNEIPNKWREGISGEGKISSRYFNPFCNTAIIPIKNYYSAIKYPPTKQPNFQN